MIYNVNWPPGEKFLKLGVERQSFVRANDKGLTLETSALETLHDYFYGSVTTRLTDQLIKQMSERDVCLVLSAGKLTAARNQTWKTVMERAGKQTLAYCQSYVLSAGNEYPASSSEIY